MIPRLEPFSAERAATNGALAIWRVECAWANTLKVGPFKLLPVASVCGPTFRVFASARIGAAQFLSRPAYNRAHATRRTAA